MQRTLIISALLCGLLLAGAASAATPTIDARQANQRARIHQGVASGELTQREAARLRAQQAHIRHDERVAKSDGVVTRRERARLQNELNQADRTIARQKHDWQQR
ncbi:hypothetical protein DFR29_101242 [Tahibacter aquaticus]|uniref:Uncharacterized protein n=1 Tax=Tahibacter aquaticus TaxID=520092 RepID=A0A4R6Z9Y2_9GAMM|nr:hypothetical protein [Tahibacter aquaticus]TDR48622.1 hypothetical protein DFR29_101242 [Tahibacter aquaticus]